MMPLAKHDILILSDSDMVVQPDYLATVTAALAQPGVGLATCLYIGRGDAGPWSEIGAAMISFQQTPNMIFALAHGLAQPCMGSTIALRRETLDAIGGFEAFADVLADDHAMGAAVTAQGLKIAVPPILLDHAGDEATLAQLWRHFLRWAVTIRDLNPGACRVRGDPTAAARPARPALRACRRHHRLVWRHRHTVGRCHGHSSYSAQKGGSAMVHRGGRCARLRHLLRQPDRSKD
jgi:ceramide glucosyltransferase